MMTDSSALYGKNLYLYEEITQAIEAVQQVREYNPPISVMVDDGVVTLEGVVTTLTLRREIVKIAARTEGVKRVIDSLRTDRDIEQDVAVVLANDEQLRSIPPIIVNSYNGRVTVSGRANSQEQIDHALSLTEGVDGVQGVVSELML